MASGGDNTDRQSFDIPFPGTWKGLVEIVDVKYNVSFWSGKPSKIQEMAIATGLHANAGRRCVGQISCHDRSGATIKDERGLYHTSVPDRNKLLKVTSAGFDQQINRVLTIGVRFPIRV